MQSHKFLQQNSKIAKSKARNTVIILVPIYRETQIIVQTIDYFDELATKLNIKVLFITTEREGSPTKNKTYQAARKLLDKEPNLVLEHYPKAHGSKAEQLNWAIEKYRSSADYFAIFDADSRPDIRGIQYVLGTERPSDIFQMPTIYLPHRSNTLASQAIAVFQTRWSYCFEIPKWRAWQNHPNTARVMYLVGHGLFVSNNFRFSEQTITEDLELGYRLSSQRATLTVVPFFDYALVPRKFRTAILQSSRWYYGELLSPINFWQRAKESNSIIQFTLRFIIRYSQILLWMIGPLLVAASIVVVAPNPVLLTIGLVSISLYWIIHAFICAYHQASRSSLILLPIKLITNGVGPMLCVIYVVLDLLKIREFNFVKTKR
jgi:cellulose synthase/poly-beta-1,6-N-acetylglucosamine synthase-like glycosyltransferase